MSEENLLNQLNKMNSNTLMETLNIEFTEASLNSISAKMPVNARVHQPYGILHGGASIVLAETVGSVLSTINIDQKSQKSVGVQVSSNHLKMVKDGFVFAKAIFLKKGKRSHLVQIDIL